MGAQQPSSPSMDFGSFGSQPAGQPSAKPTGFDFGSSGSSFGSPSQPSAFG